MRITNLKDVRAAVWAGIGYLDSRVPGWRKKINLRKLNLQNSECCVLGEVYGNFSDGTDRLGIDLGVAEALGFFIPRRGQGGDPASYGDHSREQSVSYQRLTAEWRAAYRAGQRKAKAARA